jgi:Raf kinase inhibitor-like YbhB/YbcL family protein
MLAFVPLLVAACSGSATSPSGPTAGPSATPAPTSTTAADAATAAAPSSPSPSQAPTPATFTVTSPAFAEGAAIPRKYSCDGAGISPELAWTGAPDGTQALALTVIDPDASGFVHWIAYDIPGSAAGSVPENLGTGSTAPPQGKNGRGARGYTGPCPPSGTHHYVFTLFALDTPLGLTGTPSLAQVQAAIKDHVLGMAALTGIYKRS